MRFDRGCRIPFPWMSEKFDKRVSDPAYKPAQLAAGRSTICTCSFAACIFDGHVFDGHIYRDAQRVAPLAFPYAQANAVPLRIEPGWKF